MAVPSGASTGTHEARELRDGDSARYRGKGVRLAVQHVNREIAALLVGTHAEEQEAADRRMIELDGRDDKSRLGANAILGVSLAIAHAAAAAAGMPLYRYLAQRYLPDPQDMAIPLPMVNMISGGLHAGGRLDFQDILAIPLGAPTYPQALEWLSAIYLNLRDLLNSRGYEGWLVADEGGFGPRLASNEEAIELLCEAIGAAGLRLGEDVGVALDVAATHFFDPQTGHYHLETENRVLSGTEMVGYLERLVRRYPILSLEDGLAEEDWDGWAELTRRAGEIQLVGDDLFTTNPRRIAAGIERGCANAVLIKMNQIGTLTETVEAVFLARQAGYRTIVSARSGETEDATMADLAVGLNARQIKIGSLSRSSRLAKYNQLLRICEDLPHAYAGGDRMAGLA